MSDYTIRIWPDGSSDMACRIREYDWVNTPLGSIENWPQSLKTSVDNCLASGFPGFLWWGPALIELHNDAALAILREKHPAALGRSAFDIWAEAWPVVGSLVEHVLTTGDPVTAEDLALAPKRGFGNEIAYFTFCYSALRDESGTIIGVKTVAIETTREVLARERLRASEERQAFLLELHDTLRPLAEPATVQREAMRLLAERTGAIRALYCDIDFEANRVRSVEGVDYGQIPIPHDFRIQEYARWMTEAYTAGQIIEIADIETDQRLDTAGRDAYRSFGARAVLGISLVKDGHQLAVITIHHAEPRSWSRQELLLMEVAAERTWTAVERARAEVALRASESRLQLALAAAEMGTFVWYPPEDCGVFDARMLALFGLDSGTRLDHFQELGGLILPEDQAGFTESMVDALDPAGDAVLRCEVRIDRANDRATRWIAISAHTIFEGEPPVAVSLTGVCLDITTRKHRESHQQFTIGLFRRLGQMSDPDEIEQTAIEVLGTYFGVPRCYLAYVDEDGHLSIRREYRAPQTKTSVISETELRDFVSSEAIEQYLLGIPFAIEDVQVDPRSAEHADRFAHFGIRSYVSTSIFSRGRLAALLFLSDSERRVWDPDEQAVLREVAARVYPLIQRAIVERELRAREITLQHQVDEATTELRMLSRQLLLVQEEERGVLARELHDEIGQILTGLALTLDAPVDLPHERLQEAQRIVADLTGQVRQLSMDLRPAALDGYGLAPALHWLLERFEHRTGVMVELRHEGVDRRFSPPVEIAAYRIIQEALTNVARYAGVDQAIVQLFADDTMLTVSIRDRGHGFDMNAVKTGSGLVGMRERAQLLGGTLTVDAVPGEGVVVFADLPIEDRPKDEESE